jgi:F0F1-type ATP synthase gamma subunit
MDKASTNSDRCITELSLKMNKARQILITKQITEIASYADMV